MPFWIKQLSALVFSRIIKNNENILDDQELEKLLYYKNKERKYNKLLIDETIILGG